MVGKEVRFVLDSNSKLTKDEIRMIEAARERPVEFDEDCPEIDPVKTPAQYAALMQAVAERNRALTRRRNPA